MTTEFWRDPALPGAAIRRKPPRRALALSWLERAAGLSLMFTAAGMAVLAWGAGAMA